MSEIVVVAPRGMLGRAFVELLDARSADYRSVGRPELELAAPATIEQQIASDTRLVINCAAWTDVDGAEEHEDEATAINGDGVGALAERCRTIGATLLHFSTDYVFEGEATEPYRVDQPRDPLNAYGRSKAEGERLVEASNADHLTVRTSWLYAPWGKNFVLTIAKLARERDTLNIVDDQRGRPSSCTHLAATSLALLERGERGIRHVTDGGDCTWFGLASHIASRVAPACKITPCSTSEFPRPALRPAYSVLDLARTESVLGPMPDWRVNVDTVLERAT